ncbi:MAG TPA: hypothetical protein VFT12_01720 [Thermoanaerobaculia bacterium]|nr:hypothetical protein [Thermoanaerobaculia bacterium]
MWIYDGEEWVEEGASEEKRKPETVEIPMEALLPQLQVVEVVQTSKKPANR